MKSCSADDPAVADRNEAAYKQRLSPEQYRVARLRGTERAFTGVYWNHEAAGQYQCVCCGAALFGSEHKFDSGTGWPSFYDRIGTIREVPEPDGRTEIRCTSCDAHLGHVFGDGPKPTRLRYCVNSASLGFAAADK